jgi:hypothetical protein
LKFFELLLDFMLGFTVARARSVLVFLVIILGAAWIVDWRTGYSEHLRLERAVGLAERLDALERRGAASKESTEIRGALLGRLRAYVPPDVNAARVAAQPTNESWLFHFWSKLLFGALPWFAVSLFTIPGILKREPGAWAAFLVFQIFTVGFALANLAIPDSGRWWVDRLAVPWGIFAVCAVIPISLAAIPAYKKVREVKVRNTILNNLRQLSGAADQYYLETGSTKADFSQLVGADKYVRTITAVDGEQYDQIAFEQGKPLIVRRRSGEEVRYA